MKRKNRTSLLWILCAALLTAGIAVYTYPGPGGRERADDAARSIKDTIGRRALQCYVIEGAYPPDLAYLEENYGLVLNKEDYLIVYDVFAENLPPEVRVIARAGREQDGRT